MSELKNLIVVDITDYENIVLVPSGIGATGDHVIKEIKGRGIFRVKNTSQKSRLWNLLADLKETVNTNLIRILNVGAINPDKEFKQEYEIQNLKEPCLKVIEIFDTGREFSDRVNNTFLFENINDCSLKINLTNTLDIPFTEITVAKEIPDIFQEIEIKTPNLGTAELKSEGVKRTLSWKIESLSGKETASLEVHCSATVKERKDQSLGPLKLNYLIDNKILTMIKPEIRGETDSMSGVTRDEGDNPGTWDCNVEFINDSEFKVRLEEVKVSHKIANVAETIVSENPNIELEPDQSWDKDFPIESPNVPELESEIVFTPLFGIITRIIGEINKEPTYYPVLSAEVHKMINPPEIAAYANTNMTITNIIPNKGTSPISSLEILDDIPPDFIPPETKEIKIEVKTPEGTIEIQERGEFIEEINIDPNDQNPDIKHLINVKLKGLENQLPAGSELIMSYPLLAKNPKPEIKYGTPIEIKANVPIKGKDFVITDLDKPELKVKYVKRKLKTLKSIRPGLTIGEFNISIRVENKGDVELENIIVKDKIPSGFTLSEINFDLPYELKEEVETELEVKIVELKGNDSININYSCSGSGDYHRTEPYVIVLGRLSPRTELERPSQVSEIPKVTVSESKVGIIHDVFTNIFNIIEQGISVEQLGELLEKNIYTLPPGPVRHQFVQYAKELKGYGDKALVGALRDEIETKLEDFRSKYK